MTARSRLWGLVAEFEGPTALLEAAARAREAGYVRLDAYVPFPVEGLPEALGFRRTALPLLVLLGALAGAAGGYFMQWYAMAVWYPLNVGGRPLNSWPMFIPITFELAVLVGGLTAVIGMLALNGLPMPYHPLFNVPRFARASQDGFFLGVEARDRRFDRRSTAEFLRDLGAREVSEVARRVCVSSARSFSWGGVGRRWRISRGVSRSGRAASSRTGSARGIFRRGRCRGGERRIRSWRSMRRATGCRFP